MNPSNVYGLQLNIYSVGEVFGYGVSFLVEGKRYRGEGTAPSPSQCFDAAMAYMNEALREAV